jgi:hypothetical protein
VDGVEPSLGKLAECHLHDQKSHAIFPAHLEASVDAAQRYREHRFLLLLLLLVGWPQQEGSALVFFPEAVSSAGRL